MSIRVYWKVYITEDTRRDPKTNSPIVISMEKGFYGKLAGEGKSRKLTLEELQEHGKAKILPEDEEARKWTLVDVVLQLALESDEVGYLCNQDDKKHSYNHIGNFWKHAVELGWDADEAWDWYMEDYRWIYKKITDLIKEEWRHAPKGAEIPLVTEVSNTLPLNSQTIKTQASAKTKLGHRMRAHFKKKGSQVVPSKTKRKKK